MKYNEIILDESVLDIDSWLPFEVFDEIAEIVFEVTKSKSSSFEFIKLSNIMYNKPSKTSHEEKKETVEYTGFESAIQSYLLLERVPA